MTVTTVNTALLVAIATRIPGITLANALGLVEDIQRYGGEAPRFDLTTNDGRVAFARTLPQVMSNLPDRKIMAIKELRAALQEQSVHRDHSGLVAAKNAVDVLCPPRY